MAPHNGTYCFLASTGALPRNTDRISIVLMVDQQQVAYTRMKVATDVEAGSIHAVVQVRKGQRVWLKFDERGEVWTGSSAFSGFLVFPDTP